MAAGRRSKPQRQGGSRPAGVPEAVRYASCGYLVVADRKRRDSSVIMFDALMEVIKGVLPRHIVTGRSNATQIDAMNDTRARGRKTSNGATFQRVSFEPLGFQDFLSLGIPAREMLLHPILPEKSLSMLYAPRGIGKTLLALSIGLAVASGSNLLRWSAPTNRRVLYVDGEMSLSDLQQRLLEISLGFNRNIPNDAFRILAADHIEDGINLVTQEGQAGIERVLDGIGLVILDNLSTLFPNGNENMADAWGPMQNWLLKLRRRGVSVLFVHHAGTNGRQRGTSRREDVLDTVIALRRPENYSPDQGARFEVHFEKLRHRLGEFGQPFEASAEAVLSGDDRSGIVWVSRELTPPVLSEAAALFEDGQTVREVAAVLRISKSEAGRLRQRAVEEGLLGRGGGGKEQSSIIRLVPPSQTVGE
jgi:AAA domain